MTGWRTTFLNLGRVLRLGAMRHGPTDLLVFEGRRYSYASINGQVNELADRLSRHGIGFGDHVQILSDNSPDYVRLLFALAKIGAVAIPTNTMLVEQEIAAVMRLARPSLLVASDRYAQRVRGAAALAGADDVEVAQLTVDGEVPSTGVRLLHDLDASAPEPRPERPVTDEDRAVVLFSSGSTGTPKGIIKSHGSLVWSALNRQIAEPRRPGDREAFCLPLAGIALANFLLTDVLSGATCVLMRRWDAAAAVDTLAAGGISHAFLAPTMMMALDATEPGVQFPSMRAVETSFELPLATRHIAQRLFPNARILWSYGSTEAAMARTPPEKFLGDVTCVGYASGLDEFRVDADPPNTDGPAIGPIRTTGPTMMESYLTEEGEMPVSADGWLRTGDLGWTDADHALHFAGREKDMIKSGGANVFARDVEVVLGDHPDVSGAAVLGMPDDYWGEAVVAIIEAVPGRIPSTEDLHRHVADRLAAHARPKAYHVVTELPRNPTGKVAKGALRRSLEAGELPAAPPAGTTT